MPRIGEVVLMHGRVAWLCQRRIGDEQFVLYWGGLDRRWTSADAYVWEERVLSSLPSSG